MARKDLPWQADFNQADKARIVRWINEKFSPWDQWYRPLLELDSPLEFRLFQIVPPSKLNRLDWPQFPCKVDPDLDSSDAQQMLLKLGLPDILVSEYLECLRRARGGRESENAIFADLWINLSDMGAGANLREILTADKADAQRWEAALEKHGKTWADVRLSMKAAGEIADALLAELEKATGANVGRGYKHGRPEALRARFKAYTKKYFPQGIMK
jgi:hypothetical protein